MEKAIIVHYKYKEDGGKIYLCPFYDVEISYSGNFVILTSKGDITFSDMNEVEMIRLNPTKEQLDKAEL
jgi:hypothetical protein